MEDQRTFERKEQKRTDECFYGRKDANFINIKFRDEGEIVKLSDIVAEI